jgi:hypothetical protein
MLIRQAGIGYLLSEHLITSTQTHMLIVWYNITRASLGPLLTRDWGPVTITIRALSLVEMATLGLRDHGVSEWKIDVKSTWIPTCYQMDWVSWLLGLFFIQKKKTSLGRRLNTNPGDHGSLKSHNYWFVVFYHVWGPCMKRNSLK